MLGPEAPPAQNLASGCGHRAGLAAHAHMCSWWPAGYRNPRCLGMDGLGVTWKGPWPCSGSSTPLGDQEDNGGRGEAGARTSGQRSTVLSRFKGEEKQPGWDLSLVSNSLSQDSNQPALSTAPPPQERSPGTSGCTGRGGLHSTRCPR